MAHTERARFYRYDKIIFAHPLIWGGILLEFLTPMIGTAAAGWSYAIALIFVIAAMGIDLDRNRSFFVLVCAIAVTAIGLWMGSNGMPILEDLYKFIASLQMGYSVTLGSLVSLVLLVILLFSVFMSRIDHKVTVTYNEITYESLGQETRSWPRDEIKIRATYPDMFELFLCGAGTIEFYQTDTGTVEATITHIPFLPSLKAKLDLILERKVVEVATHPRPPAPPASTP